MSAGDERDGGVSCTDAESRRASPAEALLGFFGSLVEKADLGELLQEFTQRCADLLDAVEVDVLLLTPGGELDLIASSLPGGGLMEAQVVAGSHRPAQVLPLRHGNEPLGAVDVFSDGRAPVDETSWKVAQALADVVAYAIGQARALQRATDLAGQLQEALSSRITIEQAKGILAEQLQVDVSDAFDVLRRYARSRNLRIAEVARDVVTRRLTGVYLIEGARSRRARHSPSPRPALAPPPDLYE